jgi:pimeloyl-ACP methyl ester carboxylesterase
VNIVLILGAWMGAWVWNPASSGLRALGHDVYPLTLSGLDDEHADVSDVGLETHVDDVLSVLEECDLRDVAVVGHSYSGIVAGQVADRALDRVAHTVFVDAFLPHDAFPEPQRKDELRQIAENGGRWPAPDVAGAADGEGARPFRARGRRLAETFARAVPFGDEPAWRIRSGRRAQRLGQAGLLRGGGGLYGCEVGPSTPNRFQRARNARWAKSSPENHMRVGLTCVDPREAGVDDSVARIAG